MTYSFQFNAPQFYDFQLKKTEKLLTAPLNPYNDNDKFFIIPDQPIPNPNIPSNPEQISISSNSIKDSKKPSQKILSSKKDILDNDGLILQIVPNSNKSLQKKPLSPKSNPNFRFSLSNGYPFHMHDIMQPKDHNKDRENDQIVPNKPSSVVQKVENEKKEKEKEKGESVQVESISSNSIAFIVTDSKLEVVIKDEKVPQKNEVPSIKHESKIYDSLNKREPDFKKVQESHDLTSQNTFGRKSSKKDPVDLSLQQNLQDQKQPQKIDPPKIFPSANIFIQKPPVLKQQQKSTTQKSIFSNQPPERNEPHKNFFSNDQLPLRPAESKQLQCSVVEKSMFGMRPQQNATLNINFVFKPSEPQQPPHIVPNGSNNYGFRPPEKAESKKTAPIPNQNQWPPKFSNPPNIFEQKPHEKNEAERDPFNHQIRKVQPKFQQSQMSNNVFAKRLEENKKVPPQVVQKQNLFTRRLQQNQQAQTKPQNSIFSTSYNASKFNNLGNGTSKSLNNIPSVQNVQSRNIFTSNVGNTNHQAQNVNIFGSRTVSAPNMAPPQKSIPKRSVPCMYPVRIQKEWQQAHKKKFENLSSPEKKLAEQSMKKRICKQNEEIQQNNQNQFRNSTFNNNKNQGNSKPPFKF